MKRLVVAALCGAMLSSCATSPSKVKAAYVSPFQYSNLDCDQIRLELIRVSDRVARVSGQQRKQRKNDTVATTVGIVVFWPALFFLMSGDEKEELSNLKGHYDALETAAIEKKCQVADEIRVQRDAQEAAMKGKKPK